MGHFFILVDLSGHHIAYFNNDIYLKKFHIII